MKRASAASAEPQTQGLYAADAALDFYESRYARGYMEAWPEEKKQRIAEVIRGLPLPDHGRALDFGCGNGVLTDVLRSALPPGWEVVGTDISANAIANARRLVNGCRFSVMGNAELQGETFDLLFSHHVLEHVYDLRAVLDQMHGLLASHARVLHILPCGNAGSFEHGVAAARRDGIDPALGNRFFFEDVGHVRRLTTDQLASLLSEQGLRLVEASYSHQHHGAIDWITQAGPGFVRAFADPRAAVDEAARQQLKRLRARLFLRWALRYPAAFIDSRWHKPQRTPVETALCVLAAPLYLLAKPMDLHLSRRAREEWRTQRREPHGSEMFLYFERTSAA